MKHKVILIPFLCAGLLFTSCSKREREPHPRPPKFPGPVGKVLKVASAIYGLWEAVSE